MGEREENFRKSLNKENYESKNNKTQVDVFATLERVNYVDDPQKWARAEACMERQDLLDEYNKIYEKYGIEPRKHDVEEKDR